MNKETREDMRAKKKNDDDIKFDFQEFLRIYQLEKYGSKKEKQDKISALQKEVEQLRKKA